MNAWSTRDWHYLREISGYGLVGRGVVLMEEVCHWGVGFGVAETKARPSELHNVFLLPLDLDIELSVAMSTCVQPCSMP